MRSTLGVSAAVLLGGMVAGAAEARISATEWKLADYDCRTGDMPACELLILNHPHEVPESLPAKEVERIETEALRARREACRGGDMRACTDHASLLAARTGQGSPEVYAVYAESCDAGDGFACGLLSDLEFALRDDIGTAYTAFYLQQAAACDAGETTACISQARLNVLAPLVPRDRAIWFDQLRKLCDEADAGRACALLAYIQSREGVRDYAAHDAGLVEEFENKQRYALWDGTKACRLGHPTGCYISALIYFDGHAVTRNWKIAQQFLVRACAGGYRRSCDEINRETYWRPGDNLLAMKAACEEGDFSACHYAAVNSFAPVTASPSSEADVARIAAYRTELEGICKMGWVRGCADLATMARAKKDLREAARYAWASCALSEGMGCLVLGNILKLDRGTPKAERQAVWYHRRGCELRTWIACNNLGDSYEHGTGVAADAAEAARHYRMACENDVARGCRNMAKLNETRAPEEAEVWWTRACALDARYCRKE